MYTFENLIDDVKKEAAALKVHATKEELEKLDLNSLRPDETQQCIYGLMTGFCHSKRAVDLIHSCACRYIKDGDLTDIAKEGFNRIQRNINGSKVENFKSERSDYGPIYHYSAIEAYILLPDAKNANLIAFLKSETEILDL